MVEGSSTTFTLRRIWNPDNIQNFTTEVLLQATDENGYLAQTLPATVTFAKGETELTVTAVTSDDYIDEENGVITLTISPSPHSISDSGDAVTLHQQSYEVGLAGDTDSGSASVTVTDDDEPAAFSLSLAPSSVAENAGATDITVTASVPQDGSVFDEEVVLQVTAAGDTADAADFSAPSTTLTIAANGRSGSATLVVTPVNDTLHELDETILISGATEDLRALPALLTITDNDPAPTLSIDNPSADEASGAVTFNVSLNAASGLDTTASWSTADGAAIAGTDYTAVSDGSLTIAAGQMSEALSVTVLDDFVAESDETFTLTLNDVSGATPETATATGTITDDDTRGVTVDPTNLTVLEGATNTYTVVLDTQPTDSVTVTPSIKNPRPPGEPYLAPKASVSGALTFTTSNWSSAQTVTVSGIEDSDIFDGQETIEHAVSGGDYGSFAAAEVTVTIDDNDASLVTLNFSPASIREADDPSTADVEEHQTTITASLSPALPGAEVEVDISIVPNSPAVAEDYTLSANTTLTFASGQTESTGTVTITAANNDIDADDKTVTVKGKSRLTSGNSNTHSVAGPSNVTLTIADDDTRGVTLNSSLFEPPQNFAAVQEGNAIEYTVVLDSEPTASVTVTPSRSADHTDVKVSGALTFTASDWKTAQTVTVSTARDNDVDSYTASISHTVAGGDYSSVTADTISLYVADVDTRGVTLSLDELEIDEGDSGTYTVVLDTEPTASVTVTPSRSSGDTDVTVSGALTFTTSNWSSAQTVTVSAAQDDDPDDDTAVVGHEVAGADYGSVTADSVSITVDDDETASDTVTLSASPDIVREDAEATDITVTATLNSGARDAATPVTVTVGSGTAISDKDFAAVNAFTITIPENTLSHTGTFSLDPIEDRIDEVGESVVVDGSTSVSGVTVTDTIVTIADNDGLPSITLSLSDDAISERDDSGTPGVEENRTTVTASLDRPYGSVTTLTISVQPDAPATSADYTLSANKVLTIAAEQTTSTGTVTITAVDNDVDTDDKTVDVRASVSNAQGFVQPSSVELTLEDDDTRGVSLSASSLDVDEGDSGTYTVMLDTEPTASVTVTPSRSSGDADVTVSGALTFTTSNWSSAQTVTVSAAQDPMILTTTRQ